MIYGVVEPRADGTGVRIGFFSPLERGLRQWLGDQVQIVIRRVGDIRNDQQNRYYWGVIVKMMAEELGYTPNEMHEALKYQHLRQDFNEKYPKIGSTRVLDVKEMNDYMDRIIVGAAQDGIIIPEAERPDADPPDDD